jgi:hypothetical protein
LILLPEALKGEDPDIPETGRKDPSRPAVIAPPAIFLMTFRLEGLKLFFMIVYYL